jgi:response regulator of citrate/malate metabolism
MAIVLTFNDTIQSVVDELAKLDNIEQKEILAQLRAKRLLREKRKPLANPPKGLKPLTMAQIDKIKHESRKRYESKKICA